MYDANSQKSLSDEFLFLIERGVKQGGLVKECNVCREKIEVQKNKPPINYAEGSIHHCTGINDPP